MSTTLPLLATLSLALSQRAILGWLAEASIKAAVVLCGAYFLSRALSGASAALRHRIWALALTSAIVLPIATAMLPAGLRIGLIHTGMGHSSTQQSPGESPAGTETPLASWREPATVPSPNQVPAGPDARTSSTPTRTNDPTDVVLATAVPEATTVEPCPSPSTLDWATMVIAVWLAGLVISFAPFLIGVVAQRFARREARRIDSYGWPKLLCELAAKLGITSDVRLLESSRASVPFVCGMFRAVVLLPRGCTAWPEDRKRHVLLHELAHVRRRDVMTHLLARVAVSVYWFNPAAWVALRLLVREREAACDDLVLEAGESPQGYATTLLEFARACRIHRLELAAGTAMARSGRLEGRLTAILAARRHRGGVSSRAARASSLLALAAVIALAAVGIRGAAIANDGESKDAQSADAIAGDQPRVGAVATEEEGALLPHRALVQFGTERFRHGGAVNSIAFSPDGKLVATTASNQPHSGVYLWNVGTGQLVKHLQVDNDKKIWSSCVDWSTDGKHVAAGDAIGRVNVWEVGTGKLLASATKHKGTVKCVSFLMRGGSLISGGDDGSVRVFELANPSVDVHDLQVAPPRPEGASLGAFGTAAVAESRDGKRIAAATSEGGIVVWDQKTGQLVVNIRDAAGQGDSPHGRGELSSVYFLPGGNYVLSSGNRLMKRESTSLKDARGVAKNLQVLEVRVWDLSTGKPARDVCQEEIFSFGHMAISDDGSMLATSDANKIHLWRLDKERALNRIIPGAYRKVAAIDVPGRWGGPLRFSPDGTRLAASQGNALAIYDVASGKRLLADPTTRDHEVLSVALSSDGKRVALGYQDGVQIFDAANGRVEHTLSMGESTRPFHWTANAAGVAFSPDGKTLIVAGRRNSPESRRLGVIKSWDVASGMEIGEIIVGREVRVMVVAPNSTKALVATSNGSYSDTQLFVYDLEARKQLAALPEALDAQSGLEILEAVQFLPDDRYVEVALYKGSFFRWDTSTGVRDREFTADWRNEDQRREDDPKLWIGYAAFNRDGSRLLVSTDDTLTVWDTQTGALVRRQTFKDIAHGFRLAISPDGKTLVGAQVNYAGDPGVDTIRLWDAETRKQRLLFEPRSRANEFAFSPDGTKLLTGFYRGTAILWDVH